MAIFKKPFVGIFCFVLLSFISQHSYAAPCDQHFPSKNPENTPVGIGTMSYQLLCSEEYGIAIDRWKTVLYLQNYVYTDTKSMKQLGKEMRNECLKRCKGQGTSCADNMGTELIYGTKNKLRSMVNKSTCQNLRPWEGYWY